MTGKRIVRPGSGKKKGKGIVRAGSVNKKGKRIVRADQEKNGIFNAALSFNTF